MHRSVLCNIAYLFWPDYKGALLVAFTEQERWQTSVYRNFSIMKTVLKLIILLHIYTVNSCFNHPVFMHILKYRIRNEFWKHHILNKNPLICKKVFTARFRWF